MAQFFKAKKRGVMSKNPEQTVTVQELDTQGQGVAFAKQGPLFIADTLPGDQIIAELTHRGKRQARCIRRISASALRVNPPCRVAEQCGGCSLMALPHEQQIHFKQLALQKLLSRHQLVAEHWAMPLVAHPLHYRRRARLAIDARHRPLRLGFRKAGSHQVMALCQCPILVERLERLLAPLADCLDKLALRQHLGHVELLASDDDVAMLLRVQQPCSAVDNAALEAFAQEHRCSISVRSAAGEVQAVGNKAPLVEQVCDSLIHFRVGDFVQVNAAINQRMVEQALSWLSPAPEHIVADLFAGVGNFSFPLAHRVAQVVAVEGVAEQVERLMENAAGQQLTTFSAVCANLFEPFTHASWWQPAFDSVLLDPARAGAEQAVREIAQRRIAQVVYVSCNPATLVRDARILRDAGYRLTQAGMMDMFPNTSHIESMLHFRLV